MEKTDSFHEVEGDSMKPKRKKLEKNVIRFLKKTRKLKNKVPDDDNVKVENRFLVGIPDTSTSPPSVINIEPANQMEYDKLQKFNKEDLMLKRLENGDWECERCNKIFKVKEKPIEHFKFHMPDYKHFPCTVDGCKRSFSKSNNRQRHLKQHHKELCEICRICHFAFTKKSELGTHMIEVHNTGLAKSNTCVQCSLTFKSKSSYSSHMTSKHNIYPGSEWRCTHCNKLFNHQSNLIRHVKIHTGVKPHKCSRCTLAFIERKSLEMHMLKAHTTPEERAMLDVCQRYVCKLCEKEFMSSGNLKAHSRIHTLEKPFTCSYCDRSFNVKSNMKRHEATHRGERPFKCPECSKCFTEKRSMKVHLRLHTGERPYKCDICSKTFAQLGTYNGHKAMHNKQLDSQCVQKNEDTSLNIHVVKQQLQETTSFKCGECHTKFSVKHELDNHITIHFPDHIISCLHCEKKFVNKSDLSEHMMSQHPANQFINECGKYAIPAQVICISPEKLDGDFKNESQQQFALSTSANDSCILGTPDSQQLQTVDEALGPHHLTNQSQIFQLFKDKTGLQGVSENQIGMKFTLEGASLDDSMEKNLCNLSFESYKDLYLPRLSSNLDSSMESIGVHSQAALEGIIALGMSSGAESSA